MIKLIASDLDGTLLKEGTMDINPEIYDIIRKLKAKGIVFAAVSGREYDSIERVFAPVKDDIYFIAGNGGIISYQGEIIEKMAIPADILKEVVEYVSPGGSFFHDSRQCPGIRGAGRPGFCEETSGRVQASCK